jgi:hypothetical protein
MQKFGTWKALFIVLVAFLIAPAFVYADTDVASVGETKYNTLQEALNNGEGKEVKLLKDVTEDVTVSKSTTLNLNGFKLTNVTGDTIYVKIGTTFVLKGTGTVDNVTSKMAPLVNNGTTTINGPKLTKTANIDYYAILNHGTMTITTATVSFETTSASLIDNGYYDFTSTNEKLGYVSGTNAESPKLVINGGTFSGGINTVKNDDNSVLEINDGTFTNNYQTAVMNWNVATINGGTFNTPTGNDKTNLFSGTYGASSADKGKLTVNGGTYNAEYVIEGDYNAATDIVFNGGTFNFTKAFAHIMKASGTGTQLTKTDMASYLTAGKTIATIDSSNIVGTSTTVGAAINAATTGSVVTIVQGDVTVANTNPDVKINNASTGTVSINGLTVETGTKSVIDPTSKTEVILSTTDKSNIAGSLVVTSLNDATKANLVLTTAGAGSKILGLFDISVMNGDNLVEVTDTPMTIKLKLGKDVINKYESFKVLYVGTSGAEVMTATVNGEFIDVKTTHLSDYAVVGVGEKQVTNPKTLDNISYYVVLGMLSVLGIATCTILLKKRNN